MEYDEVIHEQHTALQAIFEVKRMCYIFIFYLFIIVTCNSQKHVLNKLHQLPSPQWAYKSLQIHSISFVG